MFAELKSILIKKTNLFLLRRYTEYESIPKIELVFVQRQGNYYSIVIIDGWLFVWVSRHMNHYGLFNAKSGLHIWIIYDL